MAHLRLLLSLSRIVLAIPAVDAFMHYQIRLPHIPFELGQRHIHTPEHLALTHCLTVPHFRVLRTTPPRRSQNCTVIKFEYDTLFGRGYGCMFTDSPSESNVFIQGSDQRPLFLARLSVQPDPDSPRGHVFRACGEFLRPSSWLEETIARGFLNMHALKGRLIFGHRLPQRDKNLQNYRSSVLYGRPLLD
jgi:hypothetical protein